MPLPNRSYGLPGTKVIPDGWAASHQPVLDGTRTATVALRHPGTQSHWDEDTQTTITGPLDPYAADQPARIQELGQQARREVTVGDAVVVANYLITVDASLLVDDEDLVDVTACDDATLTGRTLQVADVGRGSLLFERYLYCTLSDG